METDEAIKVRKEVKGIMYYCFFEQSGTFKNEFKKLGYEAKDYDIQNDFGETDVICDLFEEIRGGYNGEPSIFDDITPNDMILAFFPCIMFEAQKYLWFQGTSYSQKKWSEERKLEYNLKMHAALNEFYSHITKLTIVCIRKGIPLVLENPYSTIHYLQRYWCIKPKVIDTDRTIRGDYFVKPTQYWFINCEPKNNFIMECQEDNSIGVKDAINRMCAKDWERIGAKNKEVARSMIHPTYANRFIREYIIDLKGEVE